MCAMEVRELDLVEMSSIIQSKVVLEVSNQIQSLLTSLETTTLDIAITGESGAGKSTFVNAMRGLGDEEPGCAKTGVTETTMQTTGYIHPKLPTVQLWDLPGIGTPNFQADQYLQQVNFERYDFYIVLASERFKENHASLARSIRAMNKNFYFVRSKIDRDVEACKRRKKTLFSEEQVLDEIRQDCISSLEKAGVEDPKVFLLSNFELHKYDFQKLHNMLVDDLTGQKRHVLLLSLPNITTEVIEKKKESLKRHVWKKALSTCIISVLPNHPVDCNIPMLMETLQSYQRNFGLDDESLLALSRKTNNTPYSLKAQIQSMLGKDLSEHKVQTVLRDGAKSGQMVAGLVGTRVPILSHVIAGGISFVAAYTLLNRALDDFSQDTQRVLKAAFDEDEVGISQQYEVPDPGYFYFD
ncbi:interferon-inducible GTPase 5-like [Ambystoma mexicanum]|uniref:interferon-inducible GTPase 5-like n=1 Tax=Ambystoma mexicanum TaxID=8296 RepID=UPI0037E8FFDD